MSEQFVIPHDADNPKELSIATTLIPWRKDDNRARYMGYLACGFSPEEALYMLGLSLGWLNEQRKDSRFSSVELKVPEIRKELSKEYIELDFFRNFRLVLVKDYKILIKAVYDDVLSKQDHEYLLKLRTAYTPQQLQILEQVMRGVGAEDWNFAKFVHDNQDKIKAAYIAKVEFDKSGKVQSQNSIEQVSPSV